MFELILCIGKYLPILLLCGMVTVAVPQPYRILMSIFLWFFIYQLLIRDYLMIRDGNDSRHWETNREILRCIIHPVSGFRRHYSQLSPDGRFNLWLCLILFISFLCLLIYSQIFVEPHILDPLIEYLQNVFNFAPEQWDITLTHSIPLKNKNY